MFQEFVEVVVMAEAVWELEVEAEAVCEGVSALSELLPARLAARQD